MSEMLEIILDSTNKLFKDYSTKELLDNVELGEWASEFWNVVAELGLTSIGVPEESGGAGGDYIDSFNILRLAGKYAVPLPLSETIMVKWLLTDFGEQIADVPMTLSFGSTNDFEFNEKENGFVVSGRAVNVPWARHSKFLLTAGMANGRYAAVLLPLDYATIVPRNNLAAEPRDTVIFEGVYLQNLSLHFIDQQIIQEKVNNMGALARTAMIAGAIENVLELSIFYANERKQFGRPLHRFQAIQHHLAALTGEAVASLAAVNSAIHAYQNGAGEMEVALAKIKVSEAAGKVSDVAHQLHGAIGVTHEHILHHLTRRLWSWREEFGNESYWSANLADSLMETKQTTLWELITKTEVNNS